MKNSHRSGIVALTLAAALALPTASVWAEAADIGFAKAEQIALGQVPGSVREISRKEKLGKSLFKVEVRTPEGKSYDVYIEAHDGKVLQVKQD